MPTQRTIQRYGWKPDLPDWRDRKAELPATESALASVSSLLGGMPPNYDQLTAGSCTGNSSAGAVDYQLKKQGLPFITPSRLFIYNSARAIEGALDQDAGAEIRDCIKVLLADGVCPESDFPYDLNKNLLIRPPQSCYHAAIQFKTLRYSAVAQTLWGLRYQIEVKKVPIIFGFTVYESFESDAVAKTGIMPMPQPNEAVVGGHAVLAIGYDDNRQLVQVRNSWGSDWGDAGQFWMPYKYWLDPNLCDDMWELLLEAAPA